MPTVDAKAADDASAFPLSGAGTKAWLLAQPRTVLIMALLVVNAMLISLSGYWLMQSHRQYEMHAETMAQNLAGALGQDIGSHLTKVDVALDSLAALVSNDATRFSSSPASVDALLARIVLSMPEVEGIRISDAAGHIVFGNGLQPADQFSIADRDYFTFHRDHADLGVRLSTPMLGHIKPHYIMVASRRYNTPDGRFAGVIIATIPVGYFDKIVADFSIGAKGLITVRDRNLGLITRYPAVTGRAAGVGNKVFSADLQRLFDSGVATATYRTVVPADGLTRICAYRRMQTLPILFFVCPSTGDVMADWKSEVRNTIILDACFLLLSVLSGVFLIRLLNTTLMENRRMLASERRYRSLVENQTDFVVRCNADGDFVFVNQSFARALGRPAEALVGTNWQAVIHPDDFAAIQRAVAVAQQGSGRTGSWVVRLLGVEGTRWIAWDWSDQIRSATNGYEIQAVGRDVTETKQAEDQLRLAALFYESSSEAMLVVDADRKILNVNQAFIELTGFSESDVVGNNPSMLSSGRHDKVFYRSMWKLLNSTGKWKGEIWNRRKNGEIYPEMLTINAVLDEQGAVFRYVALFSDITEEKKIQETIWEQANFDALTTLPNRRHFRDRLAQYIADATISQRPFALMFIDLDHFKEVNDTMGHEYGDLLLQEVAHRLRACVRNVDTVGRLGGDEFTVLLSDVSDSTHVESVATLILNTLSEPYSLALGRSYVSASIGITFYPTDATGLDDLFMNADQAMYNAKAQGRNRYKFYNQALQAAVTSRVHMANDLRLALDEKQFRVFYQPIVELGSGRICKAEALLRWEHPEQGLISPAAFIPVAEETGLIVPLGDWVFHQATAQAARWRAHGPIQISINKSPVQFREGVDRHRAWMRHLESLGLNGDNICFEITEGLLLDTGDDLVQSILLDFRDGGIPVSLDDFGTGYSSLSYLKKLDIDYLKIDQSFVSGLSAGSSDMALCEAIIVMAHKLGMKVIAEGIETETQRRLLCDANCDYGQGYLFSPALPAEAFEAQLLISG